MEAVVVYLGQVSSVLAGSFGFIFPAGCFLTYVLAVNYIVRLPDILMFDPGISQREMAVRQMPAKIALLVVCMVVGLFVFFGLFMR